MHMLITTHYYALTTIKVKNGSYEEPYTDPGAPVYIVSGAAVSKFVRANGSCYKCTLN